MSRRLLWLVVLDALLSPLLVYRLTTLEDAWERHMHALSVHARLGSP